MSKMLAVSITCALALLVFACTGGGTGNSANSVNNNGVVTTNVDPKNMPPGLSASPLPINGTTPGIPDPSQVKVNMNSGGTPTPGIPDPANVNKFPKGGTPTPGIPDPATLKRQMQQNNGRQTLQTEANTPPAGTVERSDEMKQRLNTKKKGQ